MTKGSKVRVYPHGSPDKFVIGTVEILDIVQRIILVILPAKPVFAHVINGGEIIFVASRGELNGKPWGPWVEASRGGHYEIEEEPDV